MASGPKTQVAEALRPSLQVGVEQLSRSLFHGAMRDLEGHSGLPRRTGERRLDQSFSHLSQKYQRWLDQVRLFQIHYSHELDLADVLPYALRREAGRTGDDHNSAPTRR